MQLRPATGARFGRRAGRGFSLVELMVTITLAAILLGLAAPSFVTWIRNAQVRTVADSVQNGLRLAQTEAVRRHRPVVFFLTNNAACDVANTAAADGRFWVIRTVPRVDNEPVEIVQCGVLADMAAGTSIAGPAAICFGSTGRLMALPNPGIGTNCDLTAPRFNVTRTGSDRALAVTVALGGQTRLCDPARTLSDTHPDGCP